MGSLRTLLSITVVLAHTYGFMFVGGRLAVQMFFILSGFLISFVLTEARTYNSTSSFYVNRFLRLFPIYWAVALFTLVAIFLGQFMFGQHYEIFDFYAAIDRTGKVLLSITNIIILGQDWTLFAGVKDSSLHLVSDFTNSEIPVYSSLIVPQAWTLGIEISFYLIAPFVLHRLKWIFTLLGMSLLLRVYLFHVGLAMHDPWTHRFFPAELALFLFGALSHQLWTPCLKRLNILNKSNAVIVTAAVFIYSAIYSILPARSLHTLLLIALLIGALPFLFEFQKRNHWDRYIGELSYPIYISHISVIWFFGAFMNESMNIEYTSGIGAVLIIIVTVLVSLFLNRQIGYTVEKLRSSVKARQSGRLRSSYKAPLA